MRDNQQPAERRPEEYLLFALTFLGLGIASGGVILSSPALGVTGTVLSLLTLVAFMGRSAVED